MHLNRRIKIQLAVFIVVAVVAATVMIFGYIKLPANLLGVGRYTVTVELPESGDLYRNSNVTYSGTTVGRVEQVRLTDSGAEAVLSLDSSFQVPSDVDAAVHSQSAIGEMYVALNPRNPASPPLKGGEVIPRDHTSLPANINALLDATNRGLEAIPQDNLQTAIDESYKAVGGLGPDIARIVKGSTQLAIDAHNNLEPLTSLIDQVQPVLDSQTSTADAVTSWASHLATIMSGLQAKDTAVSGLLEKGPAAADQVHQVLDRLKPTVPILLANLASVGDVALTYQPAIEQLLVLVPQGVAMVAAGEVANLNTKQDYKGQFLDFNLNLNLPQTCSTGFLPAQQQRSMSLTDFPDRPPGDLYCRVPQDSPFNVRGARNYPCLTRPGKRAPTVKMCESDEDYAPLNDGYNWKGDPNATLSGQDVPQFAPGEAPPQAAQPRPVTPAQVGLPAVAYDPATGKYVGPDGRVYTQGDLAGMASGAKTWQQLLVPPPGGN